MEKKVKHFIRRLVVYLLGLFILALGVSVSVKSDLGISPVNSIPYVLSRVTGLEQGLLVTLVFCGFVLIQILLLRREFQLVQLLQVVCATIFGSFVSLTNRIVCFPVPEAYIARLGLAVLSAILVAGGMFLYLCGNLIPQPAEGLCLAIEKKTGWKYSNVKVFFDCCLVSTATIISLVGLGKVVGVREGTLIAMLGVGRLIGIMIRYWKQPMTRFCEPEKAVSTK